MLGGTTKKVLLFGAVTVAFVSVLSLGIAVAEASHIDFDARRAEREAAREARRAEREARRAEREAEREARRAERNAEEEEESEPACSCRTSLKFAKPTLQFRDGTLHFIPRFDVSIRSRGDSNAPGWTATVDYNGSAAYESEDLTVPAGRTFSGSRAINGGNAFPCGGSFSHNGFELPAVPLTGITNSLVGLDQELDGTVGMTATLSIPVCQVEEVEARQFHFNLEDLFDLSVRGWRSL